MDTPAQRLENLRESCKLETLGQSAAEVTDGGRASWSMLVCHGACVRPVCMWQGPCAQLVLKGYWLDRPLSTRRPNADALSVQSLGVGHSVLLPLGALPLGALPQ